MDFKLYTMKKIVLANHLKETSDPIVFDRGNIPTERGLLSTQIYGTTSVERKETFSYIDLKEHFIQPYIFKVLCRMNRNFQACVYATKNFIIKDGQLTPDENGETGIEFLYNNWDKLKFDKNDSVIRSERIDLVTFYDKDTIFVKQWIVSPPFYRDVNFQNVKNGKVSHNDLTDLYTKLLKHVTMLNDNTFDFVFNTTKAKVQMTLVEIYDYFKGKLTGKNGIMHKSLLGKTVDYAVRTVISAPQFTSNNYADTPVDFYHCGLPLSQTCSLFTPFIIYWCKRFFQRNFEQLGGKFPVKDKETGKIRYLKLKDPATYFTDDFIKKKIDNFIYSYNDRFEKIEIPIDEPGYTKKVYMAFKGRFSSQGFENESPLVTRPATWCDILYQAAVEMTEDKHVYITRYPLLDHFGIFPNKIHVLSTAKTVPMYVGDKVYPYYPDIDVNMPESEVATYFLDTLNMSNLYLPGLGGDYDGDQVTAKGVYSQEANKECDTILHSKSHILNIYGENTRKLGNEGLQTLYMMTKFKED